METITLPLQKPPMEIILLLPKQLLDSFAKH